MSFRVQIIPEGKTSISDRVETNVSNMSRDQRVSNIGLPILHAVQTATLVALIADVIQLRIDLGYFLPIFSPSSGLIILGTIAAMSALIALSMAGAELLKKPPQQSVVIHDPVVNTVVKA